MTVPTTTRSVTYPGADSPGPFLVPFPFHDAAHVLVTRISAGGAETALAVGTGYTITGAGESSGGLVTLTAALATGEQVSIARVVPFTQSVALTTQGSYNPKSVERALDLVSMQVQQLYAENPTAQAEVSAAAAAASSAAASSSKTSAQASSAAAAASASTAETESLTAVLSSATAVSARDAAQTARDAALAAGRVYPDTAAGLAASAEGDYFAVPSSGSDALVLYREVGGTAVEQCRFPASALINTLLPQVAPDGYAWAVFDASGKVALGIATDGTVRADTLQADYAGTANAKASEELQVAGLAWGLLDSTGKVAFGVKEDGSLLLGEAVTTALTAKSLNGARASRLAAKVGQVDVDGDYCFLNLMGQSLAVGPGGTELSNTQEFDTVGFAWNSAAPGAYLAATNDNLSNGYEPPHFGAAALIKSLLRDEDGLPHASLTHKMALGGNGTGGIPLSSLAKGTSYYNNSLAQLAALCTDAQAESRSARAGAILWVQGEQDGVAGTTEAAYKAALLQLANDWDADARALTGQTTRAPLVTYQCCSYQAIGVAQLNAALENPGKIICAGPIYQFNYLDTVHIGSTDTKVMGALLGLAYKRAVIDGDGWEPLRPVHHIRHGTILDVRFNKRGLVLDTTTVPAQAGSGFTLLDNLGAAITISSVTVVKSDTVRIVAAATIPAGSTLRYGMTTATGKGTYIGGAGNLRDSQGDTLQLRLLNVSVPLHNWACLFTRSL